MYGFMDFPPSLLWYFYFSTIFPNILVLIPSSNCLLVSLRWYLSPASPLWTADVTEVTQGLFLATSWPLFSAYHFCSSPPPTLSVYLSLQEKGQLQTSKGLIVIKSQTCMQFEVFSHNAFFSQLENSPQLRSLFSWWGMTLWNDWGIRPSFK